MSENLDFSRRIHVVPRGKSNRRTERKVTVGLYLPELLVERAKLHRLNFSRIAEQALSSIIDYLDSQKPKASSTVHFESGPDGTRTHGLWLVKPMS